MSHCIWTILFIANEALKPAAAENVIATIKPVVENYILCRDSQIPETSNILAN